MHDVSILLDDVPGALAAMGTAVADAGLNIDVLYSDHDHNLVLVTRDRVRADEVADRWMREAW